MIRMLFLGVVSSGSALFAQIYPNTWNLYDSFDLSLQINIFLGLAKNCLIDFIRITSTSVECLYILKTGVGL